jgi:pyruvate dehydrogenase (quinone)
MMASLSGTLATMGCAIPYAIAAKFCFPDRVAIAFVGDGAMQMLGLNGLISIGKYWREWEDPRLIIVVLNNRDLNMVTWELRALGGTPKIEETQSIPDFPYAHLAAMLDRGDQDLQCRSSRPRLGGGFSGGPPLCHRRHR